MLKSKFTTAANVNNCKNQKMCNFILLQQKYVKSSTQRCQTEQLTSFSQYTQSLSAAHVQTSSVSPTLALNHPTWAAPLIYSLLILSIIVAVSNGAKRSPWLFLTVLPVLPVDMRPDAFWFRSCGDCENEKIVMKIVCVCIWFCYS